MNEADIKPGDQLWWHRGNAKTPCRVKELWTNPRGRVWVKVLVKHFSKDYHEFELEHLVSPNKLSVPYPS